MKLASLRPVLFALPLFAIFATAAHADSRVFLLQLGSFESETEAQTRWLQLTDKYPKLLEGLSARTLDVTLPPDNFTVYRTQAGALDSRSDAQIICDRLTSAGDECYVVETAMFRADAPSINPRQTLQQAAPQITPAPAPSPSVPSAEASMTSASDEFAEMEAELMEAEANAPEVAEPSAAMETPEFEPVANIETSPAPAPMAAAQEDESSFWDWINPFSSDDEPAARSANAEPVDEIEIVNEAPAPVEPVQAQAQAPASRNYTLPPPPAPNAASGLKPVANARAQAVAPQANASAYAPARVPPVIPFQVKRDGKVVQPPEQFIPDSSKVKVAEAIRVPVSEMQRVSPAPASATQLRALGMPSETMRSKNVWAEITYFNTQQDALAFWDQFRLANPGFPPVRVRVTNPYLKTSSPRVSLRVGPFEQPGKINDVCAEISEDEESNLNCRPMRDLGASSTARMGSRTRGVEQGRYNAQQRQQSAREPMYWVQLGAFTSTGAAHSAWKTLQQRHEPLLENMKPDVSVPMRSSALDSNYRLRTGPFPMRYGADALCRSLQPRGTTCMTVFSR